MFIFCCWESMEHRLFILLNRALLLSINKETSFKKLCWAKKKCDQYKNLALKAIFSLFLFHVVFFCLAWWVVFSLFFRTNFFCMCIWCCCCGVSIQGSGYDVVYAPLLSLFSFFFSVLFSILFILAGVCFMYKRIRCVLHSRCVI